MAVDSSYAVTQAEVEAWESRRVLANLIAGVSRLTKPPSQPTVTTADESVTGYSRSRALCRFYGSKKGELPFRLYNTHSIQEIVVAG